MSQRLKAGLSWPAFAVSAGEPDEIGPCTCRPNSAFTGTFWQLSAVPSL